MLEIPLQIWNRHFKGGSERAQLDAMYVMLERARQACWERLERPAQPLPPFGLWPVKATAPPEHGDWTSNCAMVSAKRFGLQPAHLAEWIEAKVKEHWEAETLYATADPDGTIRFAVGRMPEEEPDAT